MLPVGGLTIPQHFLLQFILLDQWPTEESPLCRTLGLTILTSRSARLAGIPVADKVYIEMRGYDEEKGEAFPADADAATLLEAWTSTVSIAPRFAHRQRTQIPGSFTFVIPKRRVVLVLAAYAHDGDDPTDFVVVPPPHDRSSGDMVESGRLEVNIDVGQRPVRADGCSPPRARCTEGYDHPPCSQRGAIESDCAHQRPHHEAHPFPSLPLASSLMSRNARLVDGADDGVSTAERASGRESSDAAVEPPVAEGSGGAHHHGAEPWRPPFPTFGWNFGQFCLGACHADSLVRARLLARMEQGPTACEEHDPHMERHPVDEKGPLVAGDSSWVKGRRRCLTSCRCDEDGSRVMCITPSVGAPLVAIVVLLALVYLLRWRLSRYMTQLSSIGDVDQFDGRTRCHRTPQDEGGTTGRSNGTPTATASQCLPVFEAVKTGEWWVPSGRMKHGDTFGYRGGLVPRMARRVDGQGFTIKREGLCASRGGHEPRCGRTTLLGGTDEMEEQDAQFSFMFQALGQTFDDPRILAQGEASATCSGDHYHHIVYTEAPKD